MENLLVLVLGYIIVNSSVVCQKRKKCPNLRTRFAENILTLEVSQKIWAENNALFNKFLMIQRLVNYMV